MHNHNFFHVVDLDTVRIQLTFLIFDCVFCDFFIIIIIINAATLWIFLFILSLFSLLRYVNEYITLYRFTQFLNFSFFSLLHILFFYVINELGEYTPSLVHSFEVHSLLLCLNGGALLSSCYLNTIHIATRIEFKLSQSTS